MYRFLLIFLNFLSFQLQSQTPFPVSFGVIDSIIETRPDWKPFEPVNAAQARAHFLDYLLSLSSDDYYYLGPEAREDAALRLEFDRYHSPNIHVIDLDSNGTPDIVHDGRRSPGFESADVSLYLNNGGDKPEFRSVGWYSGTILDVERVGNRTGLLVWTYPCCAEFMHKFTEVTVETTPPDRSDTFPTITERNSLGFVLFDRQDFKRTDLSTPKAGWIADNGTRLLVAPDTADLTGTPELRYEDGFTAVIALLPGRTDVNVVTEYTDDSGFSWCFVTLENREDLPENMFRGDPLFPVPQQIAGWVPAEKVMIR